jgi:hypothetical protein
VNLLTRVALIGADPRDDQDMRTNKALLVITSLLILPISLIWGSLYLAFGSPVGWVPYLYFIVLGGALVLFAYNHNFRQLLLIGQIDIILAPTLSMIPLGGFLLAGGVGVWGIMAPLGALVFSTVRSAVRWYIGRHLRGVWGHWRLPGPDPATIADMVHHDDARAQRHYRRHGRVHVAGALRPATD